MKLYEYAVESNDDKGRQQILTQLNLYGRTGWRLVAVDSDAVIYIYEREVTA